jgi:succinoglycan biosynthesis protein ExoM
MRICIAVPTHRRPALLAELLEALREHARAAGNAEVLVVDNDSAESARSVVEKWGTCYPVPLHYRVAAERGVSSARNCALEFASSFDLLAMIDDDELPMSGWLSELLRTHAATMADAVIGPVKPRFPSDAPRWATKGRFFDHEFAVGDGMPLSDGHTGNCLLGVSGIMSRGLSFNRRLNAIGGEDTFFFRQLRARGGVIVYASAAGAVERVFISRINVHWIWQRHFRWGTTMSFCDRHIHGGGGILIVRVGKALGTLGLGLASMGPALLTDGKTGIVTALCRIAGGLGMLSDLCRAAMRERA